MQADQTTTLNPALLTVLQAVEIHSPEAFSLAGRMFGPLTTATPYWQTLPGTNPLVAQLAQQLYYHCYCHPFIGQLQEDALQMSTQMPQADDNLLPALVSANTSRERWDAGWQIFSVLPSSQVVAQKDGRTRVLWPGEFVSHAGPGVPPRPGAQISLFAPRDSQVLQPGFYFIFGEYLPDQHDDYHLVRFYWNISPTGAGPLVRALSQTFNRFQLPFRMKILGSRLAYPRSDAAVLYLNQRFYRLAATLLVEVLRETRQFLSADTPLFTKKLADGLGLAEDPGQSESFGQQRCRLLAEGLWKAYEQGRRQAAEREQAVSEYFAQQGLTLAQPYLNPGSRDEYDFPGGAGQRAGSNA